MIVNKRGALMVAIVGVTSSEAENGTCVDTVWTRLPTAPVVIKDIPEIMSLKCLSCSNQDQRDGD